MRRFTRVILDIVANSRAIDENSRGKIRVMRFGSMRVGIADTMVLYPGLNIGENRSGIANFNFAWVLNAIARNI